MEQLIEFVKIAPLTNMLQHKVSAHLSGYNLKGDWMNEPPDLFRAECFINSTIKEIYALNKGYWNHHSLSVVKEDDGVWVYHRKSVSLKNVKLCGFKNLNK